jgi:hypothetical protein
MRIDVQASTSEEAPRQASGLMVRTLESSGACCKKRSWILSGACKPGKRIVLGLG